jgi:serine protease
MKGLRTPLIAALLFGGVLALPTAAAGRSAHAPSVSPAHAVRFVPGELVVRYTAQKRGHVVELPRGVGVREAAKTLRRSPGVRYAVPNYIATASEAAAASAAYFVPNDPGGVPPQSGVAGDWIRKQWNFLCGTACDIYPPELTSPGGVNAVGAWQNLIAANRPGAQGVKIAVLDTGVAYRSLAPDFARSPDFTPDQFVDGFDFVNGDEIPLDENGHGTHITGTVAERTHNGVALTGLAYNATIMPLRVLNARANGTSDDISRAIYYATRHGADVINMSFNFGCDGDNPVAVPPVMQALRFAYDRDVVLVSSTANGDPLRCIAMPAAPGIVIAVGGTTEGGCLGAYSRQGPELDVVAPGGGSAVASRGGCSDAGRPIYQLTFDRAGYDSFGVPRDYVGTSMAAAHVSAAAAMVIASGVLGRDATPVAVRRQLRQTARDLGATGRDVLYGSGLIDLARATAP